MSDTTGGEAGGAADPGSASGSEVPTDGGASTTAAPGTSTGGDATTYAASSTSTGTSTGAVDTTGSDTGGSSGPAASSSSSGDATTGPPPRLFDCFGCDCDADTTFCRKVFVGVATVEDPPLCPIVPHDGLESGCVVYPPDCADPPSCACLLVGSEDCFCNESERLPGAFEVTCPLP